MWVRMIEAQNVLNTQPEIPANISTTWMVISRIIQPIVWQPYPDKATGGEFRLGDMNPSFFLSPRKPGKLICGAGPALVIPTATNTILGQRAVQRWSVVRGAATATALDAGRAGQ